MPPRSTSIRFGPGCHVCAFKGECTRDRLADAAAAAGDQCPLAMQFEIHGVVAIDVESPDFRSIGRRIAACVMRGR
jgi:hypothetical protein